jgi:predicted nucleic acid-binding protein
MKIIFNTNLMILFLLDKNFIIQAINWSKVSKFTS